MGAKIPLNKLQGVATSWANQRRTQPGLYAHPYARRVVCQRAAQESPANRTKFYGPGRIRTCDLEIKSPAEEAAGKCEKLK
jgi:hypothetical protein